MADNRNIDEQRNPNQTMQQERAKAEVSKHQDERDKLDQQRHEQRQEKSAIGGSQQPTGQTGSQPASQTGEPGRARNELDQNRSEPASERR
jgi:hypothetical protein